MPGSCAAPATGSNRANVTRRRRRRRAPGSLRARPRVRTSRSASSGAGGIAAELAARRADGLRRADDVVVLAGRRRSRTGRRAGPRTPRPRARRRRAACRSRASRTPGASTSSGIVVARRTRTTATGRPPARSTAASTSSRDEPDLMHGDAPRRRWRRGRRRGRRPPATTSGQAPRPPRATPARCSRGRPAARRPTARGRDPRCPAGSRWCVHADADPSDASSRRTDTSPGASAAPASTRTRSDARLASKASSGVSWCSARMLHARRAAGSPARRAATAGPNAVVGAQGVAVADDEHRAGRRIRPGSRRRRPGDAPASVTGRARPGPLPSAPRSWILQRHLAERVRRARQARVVAADDRLHPVEHRLLEAVALDVAGARPGAPRGSSPRCCARSRSRGSPTRRGRCRPPCSGASGCRAGPRTRRCPRCG